MEPHQQRVIDEKRELDEKLSKLTDFIMENPTFFKLPEKERERLTRQQNVMVEYSKILTERIEAF